MAREDANEDDAPYIVIEERPSDLGPFLLGAALGVTIALLLAPRSGADTRNAVRQKLRSARRTAQQAAEGVATSFAEARQELEHRIETARAAVSNRSRQLGDAVAAGRSAARQAQRELRSHLHASGGEAMRFTAGRPRPTAAKPQPGLPGPPRVPRRPR
jgi:gas vesicle protein